MIDSKPKRVYQWSFEGSSLYISIFYDWSLCQKALKGGCLASYPLNYICLPSIIDGFLAIKVN